MTLFKNSGRLLALYLTAFCILGLFLANLIANYLAKQTMQIESSFRNSLLIGSYVEHDGNHRPMENAATIDIRVVPTNDENSNLLIFTYISSNDPDITSIVFENLTINNIFTSKEDKIQGFDGVLRPLKYMSNVNLDNLTELRSQINTNSDFPEGCIFKAFNDKLGPSYGIGWVATKSCRLLGAPITLSGDFRRTGDVLRSDLFVKAGESDIKINHKKRNVYFRKTN